MLKVLYLSNFTGKAGTEWYVKTLMKYLSADGLAQPFSTYNEGGLLVERPEAMGVPYCRVEMHHRFDKKAAHKLAKLCAERDIDLVHCHYLREHYTALLTKKYNREIRTVYTSHFVLANDFMTRFSNRVMDRWQNWTIAARNKGKEQLTASGWSADHIQVIFNTVDLDAWAGNCSQSTLHVELGLGDSRFVMLCTSRFAGDKGHKYLIDSVKRLTELYAVPFTLVLAEDSPLLEPAKAQVQKLGLEDYVKFISFRKDTKNLYKGSDLYVNSSQYEALSFLIIETMAAGLSAIATDMGDNSDIINDKARCDMLAGYDNPGSVVVAMKYFLGDPVFAARCRESTRRIIGDRSEIHKAARATYGVYEKALHDWLLGVLLSISITENSLSVRFFLSLWLYLKNAAANSALGRARGRLEGRFLRQAENSTICTFVWWEGHIPRAWPHNTACRLLIVIINILCALFRATYRVGKRVWNASLFCCLIGALGGVSFLSLGLFIMVILMTPHAMWNNVHGLTGVAALTGLSVVSNASRPRHRLKPDTLGPHVMLYMTFICVALVGSLFTRLFLRSFAFHLTSLLLVLLIISMVRKYKQFQLVVVLTVLSLPVTALHGYYQSYVGVDIVASQQDINLNQGMPGRVYSFLDNPDNLAERLTMSLPLSLALFLNSRRRGKLLFLFSPGVGLVTTRVTHDRVNRASLAGTALVLLALPNWRQVPVFLLVGLATIPFLPETICDHTLTVFDAGEDSSVQYRLGTYETTRDLMGDHQVRGIGLSTNVMKKIFQTYPTNFNDSYLVHTHNNYLQVQGEAGIFSLLAYPFLLLYQLKSGVKSLYAALNP